MHDELFGQRSQMDCCIVAQLPENGEVNTQLLTDVEIAMQVVTQIRNIRNNKQISPKETLSLSVKSNSAINYLQYEPMIKKLANLDQFNIVTDKSLTVFSCPGTLTPRLARDALISPNDDGDPNHGWRR